MSVLSLSDIPAPIREAISQASRKTGTDFSYLLKTAQRESGFAHDARASRSSAAGLFQFIESTWLQLVKEEGARFGLDNYAKAIRKTSDGRYEVADPALRKEILDLRFKPEVAAALAAVHTKRNESYMKTVLGKPPSDGELYITHMLGIGDGARLIRLVGENPHAQAAPLFPKAARANPAVFYQDGQPRTVQQVYDFLVGQQKSLVKDDGPKDPLGIGSLFAALGELVSFSPSQPWLPENLEDYPRTVEMPRKGQAPDIGTWQTRVVSVETGEKGAQSTQRSEADMLRASQTGFRWQTTLFDEKGNVIAEQRNLATPSDDVDSENWIERVFNPLV